MGNEKSETPEASPLQELVSHLEENGHDGLYCPGECACEKGDLVPCGEEDIPECLPGYKYLDPRPGHKEFGDWAIFGKKGEPTIEEWEEISYG